MGKLAEFHDLLAAIVERPGATTFVETGTFHGESLAHASTMAFDRLHSIELSLALHDAATRAFVPEADWTDVPDLRVLGMFARHRPVRRWGDALFVLPTDLDLVSLHGPDGTFADAERVHR
ncbi:MAG: hypothetical protein QG608_3122 [Actinomycetota bacterium]|nr:hypothetical protein [Actinomycetota bacterium]